MIGNGASIGRRGSRSRGDGQEDAPFVSAVSHLPVMARDVESQHGSVTGQLTRSEQKKLDMEDMKDALANASSLIRLGYFAAVTYFTTILYQRPLATLLSTSASSKMVHYMLVEMIMAFVCVSFLQLGILIHDFAVPTSPHQISPRYAWIAPGGLWLFSATWMTTYTMHITPAFHQHAWHWAITGACIAFNFIVVVLVYSKKDLIEVSPHPPRPHTV